MTAPIFSDLLSSPYPDNKAKGWLVEVPKPVTMKNDTVAGNSPCESTSKTKSSVAKVSTGSTDKSEKCTTVTVKAPTASRLDTSHIMDSMQAQNNPPTSVSTSSVSPLLSGAEILIRRLFPAFSQEPDLTRPDKRPLSPSQRADALEEPATKVQKKNTQAAATVTKGPAAVSISTPIKEERTDSSRIVMGADNEAAKSMKSPEIQVISPDIECDDDVTKTERPLMLERVIARTTPSSPSATKQKPAQPIFTPTVARPLPTPTPPAVKKQIKTSEITPVEANDTPRKVKTETRDSPPLSHILPKSEPDNSNWPHGASATFMLVDPPKPIPSTAETSTERALRDSNENLRTRITAMNNERHQQNLYIEHLKGKDTALRERLKDAQANEKDLRAENRMLKTRCFTGLLGRVEREVLERIKGVGKMEGEEEEY